MITIVDYGAGNLQSVEKAFQYIGAPVRLASSGTEIASAEALVDVYKRQHCWWAVICSGCCMAARIGRKAVRIKCGILSRTVRPAVLRLPR